jgi:hypothetical protein
MKYRLSVKDNAVLSSWRYYAATDSDPNGASYRISLPFAAGQFVSVQ